MIYDFFIIRKDGVCIFKGEDEHLQEDSQVMAGFLTAIAMFANSVVGENLRSVTTETYKFVFYFEDQLQFVVLTDRAEEQSRIKTFLLNAKLRFYSKFGKGYSGEDMAPLQAFKADLEQMLRLFEI
jgi:hypothetical protein